MMRKILAAWLMWLMIFVPTVSWAGRIPGLKGPQVSLPNVLPNELPVLRNVVSGAAVPSPEGNLQQIHQTGNKAIIDWNSFNIGVNAAVRFNQPNASSSALNRIYDSNPSQILGQLTANGKIYLINQNGILFGPDSQVNVHSLFASTLEISEDNFLEGFNYDHSDDANITIKNRLVFSEASEDVPTGAGIVNQGIIAVEKGGKVFLLGQEVLNQGRISAPSGQIGLAAGSEITLRQAGASNPTQLELGYFVEVDQAPSFVTNDTEAELHSDLGLVGMYGSDVTQDGQIRASTSAEKTSQIELRGSQLVSLGVDSQTSAPITTSEKSYVGDNDSAQIIIRGLANDARENDPVYAANRVEHSGRIDAPSGNVIIRANEQVSLNDGSSIDVSGLWVDRESETLVIEAALNSVQLADEHIQKDSVLQGETIRFLVSEGTSIGEVSGTLSAQELTAAEQSVAGGTIDIRVGEADPSLGGEGTPQILVAKGAVLDSSGGGVIYGAGTVETTKLLAGNRIYDISEAPDWLKYDKVLGQEQIVHERYGIVEQFDGLYYGGATALRDFQPQHIAGADAGTITLAAPSIFLDGTILASATIGPYQILQNTEDLNAALNGIVRPEGGTLKLGASVQNGGLVDHLLEDAEIASDTASGEANVFSASKLNAAGLSRLEIRANNKVSLQADTTLSLNAGGGFEARSRRIVQEGNIVIPGGEVKMTLADNATTGLPESDLRFSDIDEGFFLGEQAVIDVAGEHIDNSQKIIGKKIEHGVLDGGTVSIADSVLESGKTVVLEEGSRIDVSGGYALSDDGSIEGGDAGQLTLKGETLLVDGDLKGLALVGKEGGTLNLHAKKVVLTPKEVASAGNLAPDSPLPEDRDGLLISTQKLADTGFTHIDFKSVDDLTIEQGAVLEPSRERLHVPGKTQAGSDLNQPLRFADDGRPLPEDLGDSSISLAAGQVLPDLVADQPAITNRKRTLDNDEARVVIETGTSLTTAATGSIEIIAPEVAVDGHLDAPAGTITVSATNQDLVVGTHGRITATGWNQPDTSTILPGLSPGHIPLDGGSINLTAEENITLAAGAVLDVSAAPPTNKWLLKNYRGLNYYEKSAAAGNPGAVSLSSKYPALLQGLLLGRPSRASSQGGTLSITVRADSGILALNADDFGQFVNGGFDAVTLTARGGLLFQGDIDAKFGRYLAFDSPRLSTDDAASALFTAPWLRLVNTGKPDNSAIQNGAGRLTLAGKWIDVVGDINLDRFGDVSLIAERDLRVSDYDYTLTENFNDGAWLGSLNTPGDLNLKAANIFPEVPQDFALKFASLFDDGLTPWFSADFTFSASGKITTSKSNNYTVRPLASAGGSLTLEAGQGIEHRGRISAPLGTINLKPKDDADIRVLLAEGSTLSTAGTGDSAYGVVDNQVWYQTAKDGSKQKIVISEAPEKLVNVEGDEVLVAPGATIDVSGGGLAYGYQFQPGVDGSVNPLKNALVIVPDPDLQLPGRAIYLQGVEGLADGVYALLPENYAFRKDALVLIDLGNTYSPSAPKVTEQGYAIAGGYETQMGTKIGSPVLRNYAVRRAQDVLKEGNFEFVSAVAGESGDIALKGQSTVVNGSLRATPLNGYEQGSATLVANEIIVSNTQPSLPAGFSFETLLSTELDSRLFLDGQAFSALGFGEIKLGTQDDTSTVTLMEESRLTAEKITLAGSEGIYLRSGARVDSVSDRGEGQVSLLSPDGEVVLEPDSIVHASDGLTLATNRLDLEGDFQIDNSSLTLEGNRITFTESAPSTVEPGLVINREFWSLFSEFENISLDSATDLIFEGSIDLEVAENLSLDAARIAGESAEVNLTAGRISLSSETDDSFDDTIDFTDGGTLHIVADSVIDLAPGDIQVDGFATTTLDAGEEVAILGKGSLALEGDLDINTPRVSVKGARADDGVYQAADYLIDAAEHTLSITGRGEEAAPAGDAGGRLEMRAGTITTSSIIDNTAGTTLLSAVNDVHIDAGGQMLTRGNDDLAAGTVKVVSENGMIALDSDAAIDVSAGSQGDAGNIELAAANGEVSLAGSLKGMRGDATGRGGSFDLDGNRVEDLSTLNEKLAEGGFDERIAVRARTGDLTLAAGDHMRAQEIYLAVDGAPDISNDGNLTVAGTIDASGDEEGGSVELHAGRDVTLAATSRIVATGDEAGGSVTVGSRDGEIDMESGALIDVSGTEGGTVHYRAGRDDTADYDTRMNLRGRVIGADRVIAEGVEEYTVAGTLYQSTFNSYLGAANTWRTNSASLFENLTLESSAADALQRRAGIHLWSDDDLSVSALNLANSGILGNLMIRSSGNLTVAGSITDARTAPMSLHSSNAVDSWGIDLLAGADPNAADPLTTLASQADLAISGGAQVYSETGDINLASSGDITISRSTAPGTMIDTSIPFTVGSYAGNVAAVSKGSLTLTGGVIQTAVGDIDLRIAGDLNLNRAGGDVGTVRTLGEAPTQDSNYWSSYWFPIFLHYLGGGDISIVAGGSIEGIQNNQAWDVKIDSYDPGNDWSPITTWQPIFGPSDSSYETTQGLATLFGGDLTIRTGGSFSGQAGTFGSGDFSLTAGDAVSGRILNKDGTLKIQALGNIGVENTENTAGTSDLAVFEIFDTDLQVTNQGDLYVAAIVSPTIAGDGFFNTDSFWGEVIDMDTGETKTWSPGYTEETSVALNSLGGDVVLYGDTPFYEFNANQGENILPATLKIAAGGDIRLANTFSMLPAAQGNLSLEAEGNIDGGYQSGSNYVFSKIVMSDDDSATVYDTGGTIPTDLGSMDITSYSSLLHQGDETPVTISAGGNIENLGLRSAKAAHITAGGDIRYIRSVGQNLSDTDVSRISAGNDLVVESVLSDLSGFGIAQGGPGGLVVEAGNHLDLGTSTGIKTYGSEKNISLGSKGSDLLVVVGYGTDHTIAEVAGMFADLKEEGQKYSAALAANRAAEAREIIARTRNESIEPVLGTATGSGNLDMVESLIRTSGGADNIYIITAGDGNIGRTAIGGETSSDTGIATTAGGDISIFTYGDLNVNESRVMTFGGSDILVWADQGDINAGRGSRTALSKPPTTVEDTEDGLVVKFTPPAVGSGIRALTYDPDGASGPLEAPDPGDIYLFAPKGVIDAGEAGIAGGNVVLAATEVLNAQNISFSIGSQGVPSSSSATSGLGAVTGASAVTEAGNLANQATNFGSQKDLTSNQMADSFLSNWLDVEVIGFVP